MPPWLSGLLGFGASAAQGLGSMAKDYVWDSSTGDVKWDNIASLVGMYGASRSDDSESIAQLMGLSTPKPTGYMGGIPDYTYERDLVPNAFTSNERDNAGLMSLDEEEAKIPRRPGGRGRRYFTDGKFNPVGEETTEELAGGGLASLKSRGYYLGGRTDGMADQVPATIDQKQPARLSDGEFVVPADVVSHLGNGSSNAGADQLFSMMDRVRKARTGRKSQGKEINPQRYLG